MSADSRAEVPGGPLLCDIGAPLEKPWCLWDRIAQGSRLRDSQGGEVNAALLAMVATVSLVFEAPATVSEMMDSDAFVRVIHGPVGSGKSSGCIMELLRRAIEQAPNAQGVRDTRWAVVRNTYRELEDTTRKTFEQWLGPLGEWREADFAFEIDKALPDGTRCKAEFLFRALDRPEDVKKLLSLEITGAYVNELRELPKLILDGLSMRVGRYPAKKDGGATWYGVWGDTNPWAETSEYAELFASAPEGFALFRQPSGLSPEAENIENLPAGYYERMCAGKDAEWIDEYVKGKNPKADKGSVYGELLARLSERGCIRDFEHPDDGVFAVLDLGVSDATSIWWFRIGKGGMPDVVDWYEATGEAASHYFDVLDGKTPPGVDRPRKYKLEKIWLPHDARHRSFQTGVTTLSQFLAHFPGKVEIGPEESIEDGVVAGRWLLEQDIRIHSRCAEGVKRLKAYRYQWDEKRLVFSKKPLHDWTSHTADGWRYLALVAQFTERMTRKAPPPTEPPPARSLNSLTLNELRLSQPKRSGRV